MSISADHDRAGHDAISAELVRLTLGLRGPQRIELDVSVMGRLTNAFRLMQEAIGEALIPVVRGITDALTSGDIP